MKTALRAEVRTTVPGPALSDSIAECARDLGLLGWARDDADGAVRVHAEGPAEAVAELVAFLAASPGAAVAEQPAKVEGHEQFAIRGVPAGAFVVREHDGGFDLVLEVGEELVCWRLRKPPSTEPAVRRMAFEIAAADVAPEAAVWDRGPYEQGGRVAWPEAIERGHAVFVLHGERLRGGFALQRTRDRQWLFVKRRDAHAGTIS